MSCKLWNLLRPFHFKFPVMFSYKLMYESLHYETVLRGVIYILCKNPTYVAEGGITAGVTMHTMLTHLVQTPRPDGWELLM